MDSLSFHYFRDLEVQRRLKKDVFSLQLHHPLNICWVCSYQPFTFMGHAILLFISYIPSRFSGCCLFIAAVIAGLAMSHVDASSIPAPHVNI